MENYQSIVHSPTNLLLCKEIATSLDDEDEAASIFEDFYEDDYIKLLLDRESTTNGGLLQMQQQNSWILRARLDGIHYILTKREVLGFRYQTAYTSVTFLDRFLSRRSIDVEKSWAIRLLSIACLSLAAKMEETTLPALSDLCADDYKFESSVIQRMELLVLNTLEWEMGSITPFSFVQFFAEKFRNRTKIGLSRTAHITLATIRDVNIMTCHKPSVIAAAATLVALDHGYTREALHHKIAPLISTHAIKIEEVIACYYIIKEMEVERLNLSERVKSPELSPTELQRADDAYGSYSGGGAKRKRLVFNQTDEFGDLNIKKEKSHEISKD
ncbi:hypothetical protein MIMGU_mgv1a022525mg [Erythranthe guttata]|uniref:Cyclin-like domain-containing protein n=1 Tax=Erythranthe guttata TaxID=4155 RepID=A0A022R7D4_ERYGU|nr:PREDICTED: cyclin-D5-1-like [Erythranthe guttata]EYU36377.1 hypothetical protein MIMGU_mgv1a022525mg [Erythranthe guttata]|eukprot:XP_012838362.1 PREDICTED: cyclin-D5-1-like [Erythranthe guttata]